jgi:recombination protein RecA
MTSASALRLQIETALAERIPSALTPAPRAIRPVAPAGIAEVDRLLEGGLPIGAITEIVGPNSSGRTSLALSFAARITQAGKVCAWIDVSNALDPESAAAIGVDLNALLWVRCGIAKTAGQTAQAKLGRFTLPGKYLVPRTPVQGLHGGGCGGPHPRGEVKGLSTAVGDLLRPSVTPPASSAARNSVQKDWYGSTPSSTGIDHPAKAWPEKTSSARLGSVRPWTAIDQALRATDLLLQAGGFSAIILDMADIAPEAASRVPLATWYRYRAAAERSQSSILLLTQHPCAKSSAGLLMRLEAGRLLHEVPTVFTAVEHRIEVSRERFKPHTNLVPLRKPPQSISAASWQSRTAWAGDR